MTCTLVYTVLCMQVGLCSKFVILTWRGGAKVFSVSWLMATCCPSLLYSLYVVFMATFLAVMLFFWLELFGDLSAGNMQVRIAPWTTLIV